MKSLPRTDGFIYESMIKHRRKLGIYIIFVFAVLLVYFWLCKPYVVNVIMGADSFNKNKFLTEYKTIDISESIDEQDRSNTIPSYAFRASSYWQGDSYEFNVKLSEVSPTAIVYTTKNTSDRPSMEKEGIISAKLYSAKIDNIKILLLAYPHQNIKSGATVTGIFTEMPNIIKKDFVGLDSFDTGGYYEYMLDLRGVEMENERFDIIVCSVLLLIILYLLIKFVLYHVNPRLTPMYREANKYGNMESVVNDIENQLTKTGITGITKNNPAITEDWIISKASFKYKIAKNHAKPQDSSRYGSKL